MSTSAATMPLLGQTSYNFGFSAALSVGASDQALVITRTPMRISFAGGGTDLPDFYERDDGAVFSATVDKYVYVTVKRHSTLFDEPVRINYSRTEQVRSIEDLQNNIARECLRLLRIDPPIYVSIVADMPASTGMGGSGAFAVGLLNALHTFRGERVSACQLAEEACHVEMEVLKEPIGKQDQYAAAFGGINLFRFSRGGRVHVDPRPVVNGAAAYLFSNIMMFWTGHQRPAASVLAEQKANTSDKLDVLREMRQHAHEVSRLLASPHLDLEHLGTLLDRGWQLKRTLASRITNTTIDHYYADAIAAGAEGGRLCGAGGGGFLMFIVKPENRHTVRRVLSALPLVPLGFEMHGSRVLYPMG